MLQDTSIAPFLLAELVAASQANAPATFKRWVLGGIPGPDKPAVAVLHYG